jgi:hypothetical protein
LANLVPNDKSEMRGQEKEGDKIYKGFWVLNYTR